MANESPQPERSTRDLFGRTAERTRGLRFLALSLMAISAIFSGVVIGMMLITYYADWHNTPPVSAARTDLGELLKSDPENQTIRNAIRAEDRRLIEGYLTRRRRLQTGAWMLLGGLAALFAGAHWYAVLDARVPHPKGPHGEAAEENWFTPRRRRATGATGLLILAALALGIMATIGGDEFPELPTADGADDRQTDAKPPMEFKDNWPAFRGPTMMGVAPSGDYPITWNASTGENIVWKTPLTVPGKSSPVVWKDRIFLTAADTKRQVLQCFNREDGRLLWQAPVASDVSRKRFRGGPDDAIDVFDDTGYAAPTGVTDGKFVYVTFASSDVGCVDFDGTVKWVVNFGKPNNQYGHASSLALSNDLVIFQFDQGQDGSEELSSVLGLDVKTGGVVWRTMERPVANSWASPVVMNTGKRKVIVACGDPFVIAYDPESGSETWRVDGLSMDVAASPVFADGLIYATNASAQAMAIRPGGEGDVTKTHVVWTSDEGLPDTTSPIVTSRYFLQTVASTVTCLDAKTGKLVWQHDLGDGFIASPTLVGSRVYMVGTEGKGFVFELGKEFKSAEKSDLGETVGATPAFGDGFIYVRGEKSLYCIGKKSTPAEGAK